MATEATHDGAIAHVLHALLRGGEGHAQVDKTNRAIEVRGDHVGAARSEGHVALAARLRGEHGAHTLSGFRVPHARHRVFATARRAASAAPCSGRGRTARARVERDGDNRFGVRGEDAQRNTAPHVPEAHCLVEATGDNHVGRTAHGHAQCGTRVTTQRTGGFRNREERLLVVVLVR